MTTAIVRIPGGLSSDGVEIAVPVDGDGQVGDVLVRPAHSAQRWERLLILGGSVEVR